MNEHSNTSAFSLESSNRRKVLNRFLILLFLLIISYPVVLVGVMGIEEQNKKWMIEEASNVDLLVDSLNALDSRNRTRKRLSEQDDVRQIFLDDGSLKLSSRFFFGGHAKIDIGENHMVISIENLDKRSCLRYISRGVSSGPLDIKGSWPAGTSIQVGDIALVQDVALIEDKEELIWSGFNACEMDTTIVLTIPLQ